MKKDAEKPSELKKAAESYTSGWRYAEYAFQYGVSIVLCSLAGYWLDNWLNTGNILLIIGVLFGSVAGFINMLRGLKIKKTVYKKNGYNDGK